MPDKIYKLRIGNGDGNGIGNNDSACCECTRQTDACTCSDFQVDIACSTRGGTCRLCGWDEYAWSEALGHAQRKYLTRSLSGSLSFTNCDDPFGAPGATFSGTIAYSGASVYTPSATSPFCTLTSHGTRTKTRSKDCAACDACGMANEVASADVVLGSCGEQTNVITQTSLAKPHASGRIIIGHYGAGNPYFGDASGGTLTESLSDEDTEFAAIERMRSVNDWSEFTACRDATHASEYCCTASWEARAGTAFSFVYSEAKYRLSKTGLPPATTLTLTLEFWRKPYGSADSEYVLYSTAMQSVATASDGSLSVDGDVPIERGYDTSLRVATVSI